MNEASILPPMKAIKAYCKDCSGSAKEARLCPARGCPAWAFREGTRPQGVDGSNLKAIRATCLSCVGFSTKAVRECASEWCPLWPYRMGTNPSRKGIGGKPPKSCK